MRSRARGTGCAIASRPVIADYMRAQIEAGAQAIQIFDSWAGALEPVRLSRVRAAAHAPHLRARSPTPACRRFISASARRAILPDLAEAGGDVIGVDWRLPLDEAWERIGHDRAVQGNLDPTLLLGPADRMFSAADDVLRRAAGRPGHIFNLGHGVLAEHAARAGPGARALRASRRPRGTDSSDPVA